MRVQHMFLSNELSRKQQWRKRRENTFGGCRAVNQDNETMKQRSRCKEQVTNTREEKQRSLHLMEKRGEGPWPSMTRRAHRTRPQSMLFNSPYWLLTRQVTAACSGTPGGSATSFLFLVWIPSGRTAVLLLQGHDRLDRLDSSSWCARMCGEPAAMVDATVYCHFASSQDLVSFACEASGDMCTLKVENKHGNAAASCVLFQAASNQNLSCATNGHVFGVGNWFSFGRTSCQLFRLVFQTLIRSGSRTEAPVVEPKGRLGNDQEESRVEVWRH